MSTTDTTTKLRFLPLNSEEVLVAQADRLIEIGMPREVKVEKGKYRDELMAIIKDFQWNFEHAGIGLADIVICDFRTPLEFLCEAATVLKRIDLDEVANFPGVETPEDIAIVQVQFGKKYADRSPRDVRVNHDSAETLGTIRVGVTGLIYDPNLLSIIFMDLPGSTVPDGDVPYLGLGSDGPCLDAYHDDDATPHSGSVTFGYQAPRSRKR